MMNEMDSTGVPGVARSRFWSKLAAGALGVSCVSAQAMQISITKPGEGARFLDMDNYTVQLSGPIESGDASRLEAQLKPLQAPGLLISIQK